MPIIIWGSRGLTSRLDSGQFYCPGCDRERNYDLKQMRPWFTLYFIPIFPVGGAERFIECRQCGGTYKEAVLDIRPPSEGERLGMELYADLRGGMSVEDARRRLVELGMDRDQAARLIADMTEGDTWACRSCGKEYLKGVRECRSCGR